MTADTPPSELVERLRTEAFEWARSKAPLPEVEAPYRQFANSVAAIHIEAADTIAALLRERDAQAEVIEQLEDALCEACAIGQSTILVRVAHPRGAYLDGKFDRLSALSKLAGAAYARNAAMPEDES